MKRMLACKDNLMLYIIYTDVTVHTILHTLLTCSLTHVHRQRNGECLAVAVHLPGKNMRKETSALLAYIATVRMKQPVNLSCLLMVTV